MPKRVRPFRLDHKRLDHRQIITGDPESLRRALQVNAPSPAKRAYEHRGVRHIVQGRARALLHLGEDAPEVIRSGSVNDYHLLGFPGHERLPFFSLRAASSWRSLCHASSQPFNIDVSTKPEIWSLTVRPWTARQSSLNGSSITIPQART